MLRSGKKFKVEGQLTVHPTNNICVSNPFVMLPKEIWEMILEQVEETETIQNVFTIAPQLTSMSSGKQFNWLIGQVMPLIMSRFLDEQDVFRCRLVSKRWKDATDKTLELHPYLLHYKSPRLSTISENHFHNSDHFTTFVLSRLCPMASNIMDPVNGVFATKYHGQNPFLRRSLLVFDNNDPDDQPEVSVRLGDLIPLFQRFGAEVWYTDFVLVCGERIDEEEFILDTLGQLFQCLRYLPNLKSLKISVGAFCAGRTILVDNLRKRTQLFKRINIPLGLTKLETLDLSLSNVLDPDGLAEGNLCYLLAKTLGIHEVKKLVVRLAEWDEKLGLLFKNLTELGITEFANDPDQADAEDLSKLSKIIRALPTQNLGKLSIKGLRLNVPRLLKIIRRLRIQSLNLDMSDKMEYSFESAIKDFVIVPSVKELEVCIPKIQNFKFVDLKRTLKSFPSLQHLTITCHQHEPEENEFYDHGDEFENCFKDLFFNDEMNPEIIDFVWEEFPALQMLTVHRRPVTQDMRFARECGRMVFPLYIDNLHQRDNDNESENASGSEDGEERDENESTTTDDDDDNGD